MPFACTICEQESTRICGFCTKDTCEMHICERCGFCSDCCQCEVPLDEPVHAHAEAPPEPIAVPPEPVIETSPPDLTGIEPEPLPAAWDPAETQPTPLEESGFEPIEKG